MTESYIMYRSFYEGMVALPAKDQLALFHAMSDYAFYGTEPKLSGAAGGMWAIMKPLIDANEKRRAGGKKGGRPPKDIDDEKPMVIQDGKPMVLENDKPMVIETEKPLVGESAKPNKNVNKNVNVNSNVNVKGDSKGGKFTPPSLGDVRAYCEERHNGVDAQRFVDFYASKGWKVGNQSMKDWKAAVRTWERPQKAPQRQGAFMQRDSDLDYIERLAIGGDL